MRYIHIPRSSFAGDGQSCLYPYDGVFGMVLRLAAFFWNCSSQTIFLFSPTAFLPVTAAFLLVITAFLPVPPQDSRSGYGVFCYVFSPTVSFEACGGNFCPNQLRHFFLREEVPGIVKLII